MLEKEKELSMSKTLNQVLAAVCARRLNELHADRQFVSPVTAQVLVDEFRPVAEAVLQRTELSAPEVLDSLFSEHLVEWLTGFPNLFWVHVVMARVAASPIQRKIHMREADEVLATMYFELCADRIPSNSNIDKVSQALKDELLSDGLLLRRQPEGEGANAPTPTLVGNHLFSS